MDKKNSFHESESLVSFEEDRVSLYDENTGRDLDTVCSICLDDFQNKSFVDNCLHAFCSSCLERWTKIKLECPVCKEPFTYIISNIRLVYTYDKYCVPSKSTTTWGTFNGKGEYSISSKKKFISPFLYTNILASCSSSPHDIILPLMDEKTSSYESESQVSSDVDRGYVYNKNAGRDSESEGNSITLYDTRTSKLLGKEVVFNGSSVHGITADFQEENRVKILAFGAKSIRIYYFFPKENIKFLVLTEEQHLEDWIHDVQWLNFSPDRLQNDLVVVALAHNSLMLWNWKLGKTHQHFHCQEKCIVYSAKILGHNWDNIMLAVGTVFKEVLLWSPNSKCDGNGRKTALHRLCGHQGVIFSVFFNYTLKLLSSTSDDRTVRLWKFTFKSAPNFDSETHDLPLDRWSDGEFHPLHVLYAHESRVWRSAILESCIISVGEDASICLWKHNGDLIKREKCHKGGSIWCLDVHKDLIAATGGSDSGIFLWDFKNVLKPSDIILQSLPASEHVNTDFPRNLCILSYKSSWIVVMMTDHGKLIAYDGKYQQWREIFGRALYSSYNILTVSPTRHLILIGNIYGKISLFMFRGTTGEILYQNEWEVHDGKVNGIHWVSKDDEFVATCGLLGEMKLWHLQEENGNFSFVNHAKLHLPQNKHHWWSSVAALIQPTSYFVVGDRVGSLFFYSLVNENDGEKKMPCTTYNHIHGKNGVTDIQYDGKILYTSGRDGRVLLFRIKGNDICLLHAIKAPNLMEWIGKMLFINDDLILLGFRTTMFLGWSTKLGRIVLNAECGGGHRSWDFCLDDSFKATFAAIKKKEMLLCQEELAFTLKNSCLKSGVSGREFRCVHYLFNLSTPKQAVLACGGEDNALQIIGISTGITVLHNLSGHISSIKAITSCKMQQKNSYLMVSAGGRAQLMIWKVECESGIPCEEFVSDILWSGEKLSRKPWKDKTVQFYYPQMRYMDVAVWGSGFSADNSEEYLIATGCSDGFLRVHKFSCENCKLLPIFNVHNGNHCIVRLSFLEVHLGDAKNVFIFAGANDGVLKVYQHKFRDPDNCQTSDCPRSIELQQKTPTSPLHKTKFHQSGINALDVKVLSGDHWLVCSGGDDNNLSVALFSLQSLRKHDAENDLQVVANGSSVSAHAAQITGVKFLCDRYIVSVSIDQRVNLWRWEIDEDSIVVHLIKSKMTSIPDVSNMEMFWNEHSKSWTVVICGEGIEVFKLRLKELTVVDT